jgi:serine/threonine protein kinase
LGTLIDDAASALNNEVRTGSSVVAIKVICTSRQQPALRTFSAAAPVQPIIKSSIENANPNYSTGDSSSQMLLAAAECHRRVQNEVSIWQGLKHPNIVRLYNVYEDPELQTVFLVSEYCSNGNLLDYINSYTNNNNNNNNNNNTTTAAAGGLPEQIAKFLFSSIAEAMHYLHNEKHIAHRDLKPENILLTTDYTGRLVAKLCDFGLAQFIPGYPRPTQLPFTPPSSVPGSDHQPSSTAKHLLLRQQQQQLCQPFVASGSLAYCAPELLNAPQNGSVMVDISGRPADIWSLGCVLYAMLCGRLPFNDEYSPRLQMSIISGRYKPVSQIKPTISEAADQLVRGMLAVNPGDRMTISAVQQTEWLLYNSTTCDA